ncbi:MULTISPECIES: tetratricopeptide repeat protein [Flavobacterium]|jgi:tetratricopeptide (TPR) repeat protein|uniref:Tol-pal system YbgF family protein n=1 Tax=Flavobacterium jumunjinense TaxID=998845 RepID=A0ABV5GKH5_9FLAO|nr:MULTISPECIES: tetratricopeptide repeat protein [Flavobacterium]
MATYNKRGYKAPKPKDVLDNENEFEEVLESGESTTEEVFNTLDATASKTEEWVAKNQKLILGVVGAIALTTIGYLLYNKFAVEPKEEKALNDIYQAQVYFNDALANTENPDSLFNLALKGGEGKLGLIGVIEEYSGTKSGNVANYYAGMAYLHIKDFKNAEKYLSSYKADDAITKAEALGALGDAYSELNKVDEAINNYKKAAEADENDYTTPRFLMKAAQLCYLNNKKADANALFVKIKEKYETSREAQNIDALITMTE